MTDPDDARAQIAAFQRRAAEARRRAERAGAAAARFEEQAALVHEPVSQACLRAAALHREAQQRHLTSVRLHDKFTGWLSAWPGCAGESARRPVFIDAVATTIGMRSATVVLSTWRGEAVVAVSDPIARAAHDLEFILGEGPTHSAVTYGQTVQVADMTRCDRWPHYGPEIVRLGVRAVLAVPVEPKAHLGAVCAYDSEPAIGAEAMAAAGAIADALPMILSHVAHDRMPDDGVPALPLFGEADFPAAIHQAAGMVSQQCGCGITDALALLRARAFSVGRPAEEIAARVLRGELRLS